MFLTFSIQIITIIIDTKINQNEPLTPPAVVRVMFHFNLSGVLG